MESIKNSKLLWVLVVITVFNVGLFVFGNMIIDRVADRVVQKLQKDYSPSGSSLDKKVPDKVSIKTEKWREEWERSRLTP
jgi:hypothetical protein